MSNNNLTNNTTSNNIDTKQNFLGMKRERTDIDNNNSNNNNNNTFDMPNQPSYSLHQQMSGSNFFNTNSNTNTNNNIATPLSPYYNPTATSINYYNFNKPISSSINNNNSMNNSNNNNNNNSNLHLNNNNSNINLNNNNSNLNISTNLNHTNSNINLNNNNINTPLTSNTNLINTNTTNININIPNTNNPNTTNPTNNPNNTNTNNPNNLNNSNIDKTPKSNITSESENTATPTYHMITLPDNMAPKLQNIVSTVNLKCLLNLREIALKAKNAEYNPKRFAAVIMRIREPKTTSLIFASGKMVCTGARSEEDSKKASRHFAKIIQSLGFNVKFAEFKIQNIVGSCDVKFPIRLEGLASLHSKFCSYEPEMFPGLIYKMISPKIVLLIFVSGKIVLTGAKERNDIFTAFQNIYPVLMNFRKKENAPSVNNNQSYGGSTAGSVK